jgi:enoyl-CoA hydratase
MHLAVAANTATFSKAEINIGIIPTFGGTQRLPRNIGRKAAIELILTGRGFGVRSSEFRCLLTTDTDTDTSHQPLATSLPRYPTTCGQIPAQRRSIHSKG